MGELLSIHIFLKAKKGEEFRRCKEGNQKVALQISVLYTAEHQASEMAFQEIQSGNRQDQAGQGQKRMKLHHNGSSFALSNLRVSLY